MVGCQVNYLLNIKPEVKMKILIGVLLALAVALGVTGWQLSESLGREATIHQQHAQAVGALAISEAQNGLLAGRFDSLDRALLELADKQRANKLELDGQLAQLKKLTQEPQDDPRSFACLGMPVPAQLDRWLRQ